MAWLKNVAAVTPLLSSTALSSPFPYRAAYATVLLQSLRRFCVNYRVLLTALIVSAITCYILLAEYPPFYWAYPHAGSSRGDYDYGSYINSDDGTVISTESYSIGPDKFQLDYDLNEKTPNVGCSLPKLDPWDAKIKDYIRKKPAIITCEHVQPQLTWLDSDRQRVYFNQTELAMGGWQPDDLRCQYRCFGKRPNNDFYVEYQPWKKLENNTFIACEMIQVQCQPNKNDTALKTDKNGNVMPLYDYAHIQVLPVDPPANMSRPQSNLKSKSKKPFLDRPNIVIFIIDSMSHSSWLRELPQFTNFLKNRYDSFIFDGLVKVGLNSFPNAMAFFTGKIIVGPNRTNELPVDYEHQHYDDWPLIHKAYKKKGDYAVLFSEDYVNFQLFTYNRQGFLQMPADHYYRSYLLHITKNGVAKGSHYCFGNEIRQNTQQLNYLKQFVKKYLNDTSDVTPEVEFSRPNKLKRRRPIFAINWMSEQSHDSIDISASDGEFTRLFEQLEPLWLNDSFIFVFGDHGHRFSNIRNTQIGRIEEQMPFFSMHVPPRLLKHYSQLRRTIRMNTQRLSTWWDLYVTLCEILDLGTTDRWDDLADARQPIERIRQKYGATRGYSLLRALPYDRSCQSADIPIEFCVCDAERTIKIGNPAVRAASRHLIDYVNALLSNSSNDEAKNCETLTLKRIDHAMQFVPKNSTTMHYRVVVQVAPSDGLFEGTVQRLDDTNYKVIGEVSRLNAYNNQSLCTPSDTLKLFCYCRK